ncbi:hypothetical protein CBL_11798 [Carabus blaptoides fortunei]
MVRIEIDREEGLHAAVEDSGVFSPKIYSNALAVNSERCGYSCTNPGAFSFSKWGADTTLSCCRLEFATRHTISPELQLIERAGPLTGLKSDKRQPVMEKVWRLGY